MARDYNFWVSLENDEARITKKPDQRVLIHFRFVITDSFVIRHSDFVIQLDVSTSLDMTDECLMGQRASCSSYAIKFVFASCHF
jgi:hypothetical protein